MTGRKAGTLLFEKRAVEAGALPGVAGGAGGADEGEQGIGVAVVAQVHQALDVAARGALVPELAAAAAPEDGLAALEGERDRRGAHPRHHEHGAVVGVLHDAGDEPVGVVREVGDVHGHHSLTGMPKERICSLTWRMVSSPKWNTLAASTASASPSIMP